MLEYRRFIAYIYEYTNGKKNRNAGFAKVESRNGICRIQVHLQKVPRKEEALDIYGFVRKGGKLSGIFLGHMYIQGMCADARIRTSSDRIAESGYGVEQLAGIWIEGRQGEKYITVFDDEGIDAGQLMTEPAAEEEEQEEESIRGLEALRGEEVSERKEDTAGEEETGKEKAEETVDEEKEGRKSERELTAEEEQEEESIRGLEVPQGEEVSERKEDTIGEKVSERKEGEIHTQEAAAVCQKANCCRGNRSCKRMTMERRWETLCGRCPHFHPFGEEEAEYIQITPRELSYIMQGGIRIGNNSFLLHGFNNYRHLLLGRKKDGGYILGIPGYYENQERIMANMFNFPIFRESEAKNPQGRFGYWCRYYHGQ